MNDIRHRFLFGLIHLLPLSLGAVAAEPTRPNVILMMADDLGYGDISCNGSKLNRTPVLDRMAAEGVRLTDYHSGSTVCTPSRMALLSGYYPRRVSWPGGVLGYKMNMKGGLASEVRTLAEIYQSAGYCTGMVGKWHLGDHPTRLPRGQGFDESYFIKASNNQTTQLWRDDQLVMDPFDNRLLTESFITEAIGFIRKHQDKPFFLYLPFTAPHFPVQSHPNWKNKSNNAAFGDVVEELDSRIGDVMNVLNELNIAGNTLVVFTSDNGPQPSKKNKTMADPYRGHKWSSLEGGTRVPCIFHWPGKIPKGRIHSGLTASIDMLPTLAQACGLNWQAEGDAPPLDGMPLWDAINGKENAAIRDELILWDGWAHPHAIRMREWKLFFEENEWVDGSNEGLVLFNLSHDIRETRNIASEHPDVVTAMESRARTRLQSITEHTIPLGADEKEPPQVPQKPRWLQQVRSGAPAKH